ncbi:MAG: DNA-binding protein, partial [Actinobacteria bacterium]|nr:DNA-binding protein [Actinomycetota bacterium]
MDALFEAGCDDATPETVVGSGWLHFDRDAASLLEALLSAIHDVESTGLTVCAVVSDDLVSLKDIAKRTDRTYEAARLWASGRRGPGGFPPPVTAADGWSLYSWVQVSEWLRVNLLSETAAQPDKRILAAMDPLVRARCLLDNRGGLEALADVL